MTDIQPQYASGDPVLVAGEIVDAESRFGYLVETLDGGPDGPSKRARRYVRAADVHPVPPTPDPRDTAIAEVRTFCHSAPEVHRQSSWNDGYVEALAEVREILDRVTPVPAPPTPTPTGWTAERVGDAVEVRDHDGRLVDTWSDDITDEELTIQVEQLDRRAAGRRAVLALRAEEAAAAAPATTDDDWDDAPAWAEALDDRVQQAARIVARLHPEDRDTTNIIRAALAVADDAHRAAGRPS